MTPTARTLHALRRSNYVCDVVERWLPRVGKRRDFLGCMDIVACRRGVTGCLGIQATTSSNLSGRIAKARGRRELVTWIAAGNAFEVWAWGKNHEGRWEVRRVALARSDLRGVAWIPRARARRPKQKELF
jgi:hypothetical protein